MKTTSLTYRSAEFLIKKMGLGNRWRFPESNICLFVRAYGAAIAKFIGLTFVLGFLLNSFVYFWLCVLTGNLPSEKDGYFVFIVFGFVLSLIAGMLLFFLALDWIKDNYREYRYKKNALRRLNK